MPTLKDIDTFALSPESWAFKRRSQNPGMEEARREHATVVAELNAALLEEHPGCGKSGPTDEELGPRSAVAFERLKKITLDNQ